MYSRKWIFGFTSITLIVAFILNFLYFHIGFGMFFFIPMFGIIVLYPNWIVGNMCSLVMILLRLLSEYLSTGDMSSEFLVRLAITSAISWFILSTFTFIVVKLNVLVQRLEYLAISDNLTSALNRRYLELYSEKLLANAHRYKQPLSILVLDIDHFKSINDRYCHSAGDLVLQTVARIIQKIIRQTDIFVRYGGEEFVVILPNTPLGEGIECAERIKNTIQMAKFEFRENLIDVTVSIGASQYEKGSLEKLFDQADQALYLAKEKGRNQVVSFPI